MSNTADWLEFGDRDAWVSYAMQYMRDVDIRRDEGCGLEIQLISSRGIIGKWLATADYGYIEERRTPERLNQDEVAL